MIEIEEKRTYHHVIFQITFFKKITPTDSLRNNSLRDLHILIT